MSASKKKKLKQNAEPSAQQLLEQQKAAEYKKKVRTYTIIGIVVVVLVALLLVWNSGIFQRGQTAAVVGDTKYTVNDVSYFYQSARYQSFYMYSYLGYQTPSDDDIMDSETGETYREFFLDSALDSLVELTALYDEAVANGYKDANVADAVDAQIKATKEYASTSGYSYSAFLKMQYGRYMTPSAFKSILTRATVVDTFHNDYAATLDYSDEALQTYYEANKEALDTFDYSYLYFTPAEDAQDSTAALSDAKADAEAALSDLNKGIPFADVVAAHEPANSNENSRIVGSSLSSVYKEELIALGEGETALVPNGESGYYVLRLNSRSLADTVTADVRHILINAETPEDGSAPDDAAWAEAEAKIKEIEAEYLAGEQTEDAFAALANKYSTDGGSNTNGGLYTGVSQGSFVDEFDSWLFDEAHQPGDMTILKHEAAEGDSNPYYGYHLTYFVGNDLVWKNTAFSALQEGDLTAWLDGLTATYSGELTAGAKHVAD